MGNRNYRELLKHFGIYGIGQILSRMASILLLPLYTACLTPADYGQIAVLDVTIALLAIIIGPGLAEAANRYHFETSEETKRDAIWWTAMSLVGIALACVGTAVWFSRFFLSRVLFGPEQTQGPLFLIVGFLGLAAGSYIQLIHCYLRAQKHSLLVVSISLVQLLICIALNVTFLAGLKMGILGLLLGNTCGMSIIACILFAIFIRERGGFQFDFSICKQMYRFGYPLVITWLMTMVMHDADKYMMKIWNIPLEDIGIYSLAYRIGFAINIMILMPFASIWKVLIYEMEGQPDANVFYAKVFRYFSYALTMILLGVSCATGPLLDFICRPEYAGTATVVPIVALAYFFFSLEQFASLPARLTGQTHYLLPAGIAAGGFNLLGNWLVLSRYGMMGAAFVSVATFMLYAGLIHGFCRRIRPIPFPIGAVFGVLAMAIGIFVAQQYLIQTLPQRELSIDAAFLALWFIVSLYLFREPLREFLRPTKEVHRPDNDVAPVGAGSGTS